MTSAALFSKAGQAAQYSLHRPTYPIELYTAILSQCHGRHLAIDIATGSGQAATALAEHFEQVVAQDGSAEQLLHAHRQHSNVSYQQADAHSTGVPDACADLVTVAQALHWFDVTRFYQEVRRILKPAGCFAAWTYGLPTLCEAHHPANAALMHMYSDVLGSYWADGRKHVEQAYAGIEPVQGRDFGKVQRLTFQTTRTARVDDVVGFVKSWSAYHSFLEQNPATDPIHAFRDMLCVKLGGQDTEFSVIQTITLILATGPLQLVTSS